MKKAKQLGYAPLPNALRSTSPLDRVPSGALRRGASPAEAMAQRRPAPKTSVKVVAPGQPAPPARSRDRFVSLPDELQGEQPQGLLPDVTPTIFEDLLEDGAGMRGRITVYCVAESLDRKALELRLRERGGAALLHQYPDVLYGLYESSKDGEVARGEVFYFDYGCLAFWGLSERQEREVMRMLAGPCLVDALPSSEVEVDEFQFHYTISEKPHIQNDTITINYRLRNDHLIKLSISHALAQSAKLSVYEERVIEIVESTKDLPETLAATGEVGLSRKQIARLIGRVFIQKSAVNLLSTVLDTPEFFWSAPDSMQNLYKRVCEYLEYDTRVEVLNNRFQVLQEMLDMLRDHSNNAHTSRLEWIVIWLIVIEVVVGLFECASILAGRDFHNFNVLFRDNEAAGECVGFTAAQIPNIDGRRYPPELAGRLYPKGLPIWPEEELEQVIAEQRVDRCLLSYSDLPHSKVMQLAARCLAAGADFGLVAPARTQLPSEKPVVAVCAVRTGCGKSQTSRYIIDALQKRGKKCVLVRHPMAAGWD
ncbi:Sporulation RMD1 [Micractinium conductrix]|uniref:Sporulation RMD1 n=1 Tax=Micractinium conductrix TaxID=554055 RepID=A0A2P6VLA8_9CHLO|nr:Sporulation RMD1 [Micractinium conductrix]|eukprot:PSC74837.1 Sporulation RMD1 [Micractinium conductrix]